MGCDVCSMDLAQDSSYMLSTTEVVTNVNYWEFFFRYYYPQQVEYVGEHGEKLASYVFGRAADNTGWVLCASCIDMFSVDKSKARQYFQTWQQTGKLPSYFGTAEFPPAFAAAQKAWETVFGTEPKLDAKDPALPFAASVHASLQAKEITSKKAYCCNTHGTFWGSSYPISFGDGYYVDDATMQKTGAMQDFFAEMKEASITQSFGWLICERCVDRLGLSASEKDAAKKAALDREPT